MTPEEALAIAQAEAEQPSTIMDTLKAGGSSFVKGITQTMSGMGNVGEFAMPGELTQTPDAPVTPEDFGSQLQSFGADPAGEVLESAVPGITTYEPQTQAGKFGSAIGSAASGVVLGPGGVIRKGVMSTAAGGASEALGSLAQEHAPGWETAARVGGMVVGGIAGGGKPTTNAVLAAAKQVAKSAPSAERLRSTVTAMYDLFDSRGIIYDANTFAGLGQRIHNSLLHAQHRPSNAHQAFQEADQLTRQALGVGSPNFMDMERLSQRLGVDMRSAYKSNNNSLGDALGIVRDEIDDFTSNAPLMSQNPASAADIARWRPIMRGLALMNMKSRRMTEMLEAAGDYQGGFLAGLQAEINRELKSKSGRQLFNDRDRTLLRAVRDGNRPVGAMSVFGVDMKNPRIAHLMPATTAMAAPATVALAMGSPAALPVLGVGALALGGTAVRALKPGAAARRMRTAISAQRSPELDNAITQQRLEQNRRRFRTLTLGIPAGRELEQGLTEE